MRRIFLIIISCAWLLPANATNTLLLPTISAHPGDELTVSVMLENSDAVTALQADIPLGENLQYVASSAVLNSARNNGHSLVAAAVNDTLHITIFSLTQTALQGSEGELLTFRVILGNEPATYPLSATTVMTGESGQAVSSQVTAGSATLLSPKIQVVTTSLDYGHIPIRANYNRTLQVRNAGNEPLHISNMLFSAEEFSVSATEYTIAAGVTQNIVITYAPTIHGAISESVRLRSDAINDADVYGANVCQLIADPFSVNELRMQAASGISDEEVTIVARMNNMESIVGAQFSLKLPAALEFVEGSAEALERASGHSVMSTMSNDTLTLLLYHTGNVAVSGEDGDLLSFRVRLNGTSGNYTLNPINTVLVNAAHYNMVSAVYNANVTIQSPTISGNSSLAFGHISADQPHVVNYAIRNTGLVPLTVERATFLSEGLRVVTPLPIEIAKNVTQNIQVEFTPWQEGALNTTMQVYSNDPACRMKSVSMTADVFEPNSIAFRGETVSKEYHLYLDLTNYSDIAGLQFDIEGLMPWTSYALTARASGHQIVIQPLDATHHRVILFALNNATLSGHEGAIIEWKWEQSLASAMNGQTIEMDNVVLVHPFKGNREVEIAEPFEVSYTPSEGTAISNVHVDKDKCIKLLRNGQILIQCGDKDYTLQGQEVREWK